MLESMIIIKKQKYIIKSEFDREFLLLDTQYRQDLTWIHTYRL